MTNEIRNLRQVIIEATSKETFELMAKAQQYEQESAEYALLGIVFRQVDAARDAHREMNEALMDAEARLSRARQKAQAGEIMNRFGELQANPERLIARFEVAIQSAVTSMTLAEKALGEELL